MATLLQRIGIAGSAVVLLLALVGNGVAGYRAVQDQAAAFNEMYRAQRLLRRITLLRLMLSDTETGQRGFLLAREDRYLDSFGQGQRATLATLDTLEMFARPFPDKIARMPTVRRLTMQKLAEMDSSVMLGRAGRFEEAIAQVRTGRGKAVMDSLRAQLRTMEVGAQIRRDRDLALAERASARARRTIAVSSVALILLVGLLGWTLRRTLRQRERAAADLARANGSLSQALAEREAALSSVQAMQAQLVQQEKLAGLGRLTAGVAHELKNPLNFVTNFAQLSVETVDDLEAELRADGARPVADALDASGDLLSDLRANAQKIHEHGRRADAIIKSMLAHSRSTPGPRRPARLNSLMDEYVGLAYHGMRATHSGFHVDLHKRFDPDLGEVEMVPEEMGRVFINLLDNAFAAVRLRAATGEAGYTPRVTVATHATPGGGVRVTVADNGTGMPADVQARIFEPFYTTKPSGEGTGLGLSLSYDIVVLGHGGTLSVDSREGAGTTFTVSLPGHWTPPESPDARVNGDARPAGVAAGGA